MLIHVTRYAQIEMHLGEKENTAVQIAADNLLQDFRRVLDVHTYEGLDPQLVVEIHTLDTGWNVPEVLQKDVNRLFDEKGEAKKEAYLISSVAPENLEIAAAGERPATATLYIVGTDRRGTVFGIYEFSRRVLGVSPWYFFADVPVKRKAEITLDTKRVRADWPLVEYRGFFINDEEELDRWAQLYLGEETLGVKTYEKIFELALRLKLNYIWPAMHVNSFNMQQESGALADRMGIVIGTSHCDMLMRSNHREWQPWLQEKGYEDVEYDFSVPGRNRDILTQYWEESVEQNRDKECCYTLGMRGIHDSGFETRAFEGLEGEELLHAKIDLLETVIGTQEKILDEKLGHDTLKTFIPYKEVLELYDNGLVVPEDLTLIWVNDNYGYVRRYPNEEEQKRSGGNGLYYHNSYWAAPEDEASYTFITTIPLAHTRNELQKAYDNGIRRIWVTNFGAIKPLEMELSFYADFAWDCGKSYVPEEDEEAWLEDWIDDNFSGRHGVDLAQLLLLFDQVTNARKLEHMAPDVFSQTTCGDEAAARLHIYEVIFEKANAIYDSLPDAEKDAFFQLILMKVHAAYYTNAMFYWADRSALTLRQGKAADAGRAGGRSQAFRKVRRSLLYYYNHVMSRGKWNGILTPDDFAPPRCPSDPPLTMPLYPATDRLIVTLPNEADPAAEGLTFVKPASKWIEIANAGEEPLTVTLSMPAWITMPELFREEEDAENEGIQIFRAEDRSTAEQYQSVQLTLTKELRITTELDWNKVALNPQTNRRQEGEITITAEETGEELHVRAAAILASNVVMPKDGDFDTFFAHFEDDGMITVEADSARELLSVRAANAKVRETDRNLGIAEKNLGDGTGWNVILNLGRMRGPLIEAKDAGAVLTYDFTSCTDGDATLEIHRFPTLNSVGEISIDVSVDDGEYERVVVKANDAYRGEWLGNVKAGVDKLYLPLPGLQAGSHTLRFRSVQPYFAFSRFVIYTGKVRPNSLGLRFYDPYLGMLPEEFDADGFSRKFYGEEAAMGEGAPVVYMNDTPSGNPNKSNDYYGLPKVPAAPVGIPEILSMAKEPRAEHNGAVLIEAAAALMQTENAYMTDSTDEDTLAFWSWANAPSHGESGLSMYLRYPGLVMEDAAPAPALHYMVQTTGGAYTIWARVLFWGRKSARFTLGIDGSIVPEKELYDGQQIWNYSAENVWEWIPLYHTRLDAGEHGISFHMMAGETRIAQLYLTRNGNRPPASL